MDIFPGLRSQQGSMMLEALISILIFSMGILGIVGLQANSIKMSTDAKYRSQASLLANQYLATMWADIGAAVTANTGGVPNAFNPAEFASYTTGGANFNTWRDNQVATSLPNATATVTANTVLTCGNVGCPMNPVGVQQNTRTDVSITIRWQLPGGDAHTYSTTALVSAQKQL